MMGFFDIFDSSNEEGKKDGEKGEKNTGKYLFDEDYKKGYDYGEGIKNGSEHQEDFLEALDRSLFKSKEYNRGHDRGEKLYHGESTNSEGYEYDPEEQISSSPITSINGKGMPEWGKWILGLAVLFGLAVIIVEIISGINSRPSSSGDSSSTTSPASSSSSVSTPTAPEIKAQQMIEESLKNWHQKNMSPDSYYNPDNYVIVGKHVWAIMSRPVYDGPVRIIHSDDYGNSWEIQWEEEKTTLKGIFFIDESEGMVVVGGDTLMKTSDGGNTWNEFFTLRNIPGVLIWRIESFKVKDRQNITVWDRGGVNEAFVTKDGGKTWELLSYNSRYYGSITGKLRTSDGGTTWQSIDA